MPAAAAIVLEEAPGILIIFCFHENADATFPATGLITVLTHPLFPDDAEEEGPGRVHDGDVWQYPGAVIGLQTFDHAEEEWVVRSRAHGIVRDARGFRASHPRSVGQKGVEPTVTAIIQINVDSAVVGQDKISDRVCALDWIWVCIKGVYEPRVLGADEFPRLGIGPESVLVVRMEVYA